MFVPRAAFHTSTSSGRDPPLAMAISPTDSAAQPTSATTTASPASAPTSASVSTPPTAPAPAPQAPTRTLTVPARRAAGWTFPAAPRSSTGPGPGPGSGSGAGPGPASTAPTSPPRRRNISAPSPSPPLRSPRSPPYSPQYSPSQVHAAHRRLSSASMPRIGARGAAAASLQLPAPEFAPLDRQTSAVSSQSAMYSVDEECPPLAATDIDHPLQAQVERLMAKCREHELRFRSAKASFEHRVLTEFPSFLHQLTLLDDRAERATASIYAAIKAARPEMQAKLRQMVEQGEADVETMRERTTPWRDVVEGATAPEEELLSPDAETMSSKNGDVYAGGAALTRTRSGDSRRILKIERMRSPLRDEDAEALSLLEHYGEAVIRHLSDQIISLKSQLSNEGFRRFLMMRTAMTIGVLVAIFLCFYGFRRSTPAAAPMPGFVPAPAPPMPVPTP